MARASCRDHGVPRRVCGQLTRPSGANWVTAAPLRIGEDGAHGEAEEEDSLAALLGRVAKRRRDDEAMRLRVDADTDRKMDNGVQINPALRERARRAAAAEAAAGAGPGCCAGHSMTRRSDGAASPGDGG